MGSFTDQLENDNLNFLLNGVAIPNIPTATSGSYYLALYTTNPTDAGGGTETVYTNYARVAILRNTGVWTISGNSPTQAVNAAQLNFPTCGVTGATITGFSIMSAATPGTGTMFIWGALGSSLAVSNNITPQIAAGALVLTLD